MCGIFSYTGTKKAGKIILEGLTILQNRGYDSVGITTLNTNEFTTTKFSSVKETSDGIQQLSQSINKHGYNKIGIGHTRWATHGSKSIKNSHPHFDIDERFAIVHNGIIENYLEIKKFLKEKNIYCSTETDTEVIVQLLSYYNKKTNDVFQALKKTLKLLEGTWALVILDKENPTTLFTTRKGSPLLIGIEEDQFFISSEISAFSRYTSKYINLFDNEILIIKDNKLSIQDGRLQISKNNESISFSPTPYEHWTLKEIKEQEFSINHALNNGGRIENDSFVKLGGLHKKLLKIENLIIVGCGTSKNAGDFVSSFLRKISGFNTVSVVDASEFDSEYLKASNVGILTLSQSGETQDVLRCLKIASNHIFFSVINKVDSSIANITKCGVYLNAGREMGVASTKAFTSTVVVLHLIGIWFAQHRNLNLDDRKCSIISLNKIPLYFSNILNSEEIDNKCNDIANYLLNKNKLFILGKGNSHSIANEGSLKIKEISYLHAEGYSGGALKHGPFALIEKGTPIIIILINDINKSYMESTINEVKSRGAYVITITDVLEHDFSDIIINVPNCGTLTSLLTVIPLQLIAYKLSVLKHINPDKPRNLAKVVTVI